MGFRFAPVTGKDPVFQEKDLPVECPSFDSLIKASFSPDSQECFPDPPALGRAVKLPDLLQRYQLVQGHVINVFLPVGRIPDLDEIVSLSHRMSPLPGVYIDYKREKIRKQYDEFMILYTKKGLRNGSGDGSRKWSVTGHECEKGI